jgi:hypothetical protein
MPIPAAQLFDAIVRDMVRERRVVMESARDRIKERLSKPVERRRGPRGGTIVVRSEPGEPARKDSGDLVESIRADVGDSGDVIEGVVYTTKFYAPILEGPLNRLVATDLADQFTSEVLDADVRAISTD